MKESLILYNSLGKVLRVISAEQCQRLMLAIFDLNETGVEADLSDDPVLNAVWIIQADQILRDTEKYERRVQAGKTGGRPKKTTEKPPKTIGKPLVSDTVSVSDTVTDTVTDTVSVSKDDETVRPATAPSREEVLVFCRENHFTFSPERFYDCYQKTGWTIDGKPIRSWKKLAFAWQQKENQPKPHIEKSMPSYIGAEDESVSEDDLAAVLEMQKTMGVKVR